jgi:DNA-binding NarL/FixJ family response regulator
VKREHPPANRRRPELVRTGFRLFLETQDDLEVVGEAGDGAEAIERARETSPTLS